MSGHGGGKPIAAKTDFDAMTHEQMYALLKSADMHTVSNLSEKLTSIATMVDKIGNDLKGHVTALEWEGKGGEAFREWGNQTANATLKLGEYAKNAGKWMGDVSQAIVEAHANMPALSLTTGARSTLHLATEHMKDNDSPTYEKSAMMASSRIETTRGDAAGQMQKLATAYVHAGTQINALKPPTFPPPAHELGSHWIDPHVNVSRTGEAGSSPNIAGPGSTRFSVNAVGGGQNGSGDFHQGTSVPGTHGTVFGVTPPPTNAHMEIDSVTSPTAPPPLVTPPNAPSAHSVGLGPMPTGFPPPSFSGPNATTSLYKPGPGDSVFTGKPNGTPGGRIPRMLNSTEYSAGGTSEGGRGPSPRTNGILGGRPIQSSTGRPPARLPRGTVIGSEEGSGNSNGRPMTGRGALGMHGGGESGAGAGRNGLVGGRRLASEAGGVVGKPAGPGRPSTRPFTQGGSGLVRGEAEGLEESGGRRSGQFGRAGMMPRGGSRGRRRSEDEGAERPDYLTEEEDTWQQSNRRVVPPVID